MGESLWTPMWQATIGAKIIHDSTDESTILCFSQKMRNGELLFYSFKILERWGKKNAITTGWMRSSDITSLVWVCMSAKSTITGGRARLSTPWVESSRVGQVEPSCPKPHKLCKEAPCNGTRPIHFWKADLGLKSTRLGLSPSWVGLGWVLKPWRIEVIFATWAKILSWSIMYWYNRCQ